MFDGALPPIGLNIAIRPVRPGLEPTGDPGSVFAR
jgi:hypothetical protein